MYFTLILIWSLWAMSVAFLASAGDVTYDAGGYVTINQVGVFDSFLNPIDGKIDNLNKD